MGWHFTKQDIENQRKLVNHLEVQEARARQKYLYYAEQAASAQETLANMEEEA